MYDCCELHSRRQFMHRGAALLAAAGTVPLFVDRTVMAMVKPDDLLRTQQDSGKDGKILVIIQLSGGNDGLNTVVPYADDAYYRARPAIAKPRDQVLKLNDYVGLNPNLAPLKSLFDNGEMTLIQGVGYPNPNRSHFRSMDIWHTAISEEERTTSGWLGRYFDNTCMGNDPKAGAQSGTIDATLGVSMGETAPLAMQGEYFKTLAFERAESFRYQGQSAGNYLKLNQPDEAQTATPVQAQRPRPGQKNAVEPAVTEEDQVEFLSRTAMDAQMASDRIRSAVGNHNPTAQYPQGEFGQGLRTVAAMIRGELPTRVYYVQLGGFDTHANQNGRHDNLMQQLAQGVSALMADLKEQKLAERVMVMTFSEFGRRVAQNASGGTDHGAAAPMFLFGQRLTQGVVGKHPSLTDLDSGDLKFAVDFRSVYASLLQDWLDTPSKPILGKQFPTAKLVKG
jgi:uncharacterized protein (DUF1501 family)